MLALFHSSFAESRANKHGTFIHHSIAALENARSCSLTIKLNRKFIIAQGEGKGRRGGDLVGLDTISRALFAPC